MTLLYKERIVSDVHEFACHLYRLGCERSCFYVIINNEVFEKVMKFLKQEFLRDHKVLHAEA